MKELDGTNGQNAAQPKQSGTKKNSATPEFDVIVIGTGMGGSAAGAISALHGLKTLILEKNPTPGGSCSYYYKDGFKVDTGTHLFIRGNKGPFGVCTRRLGLGEPLQFLHADPLTSFRGFNMDFTLPLNPLTWPYAGLKFLYQARIPPTQYHRLLRLGFDIMTMPEKKIDELNTVPIHDFLLQYTDNIATLTVVGFLMGLYFILPTWEASAGESIWNMQRMIQAFNLGYPKGGCSVIPTTFLKGAANHGAQLRLNAGVKEIMVENGRTTGVILEDGQKITAAAVISTSAVKDTVLRMAGEQNFPADYAQRVRSIKPALTASQAKIGVRGKYFKGGVLVGSWPINMPRDADTNYLIKGYEDVVGGKVGEHVPVYIPVPSNFDPELAPEGHQLFTVVAVAPTKETTFIENEDVWAARMLDAVHRLIPGVKENTVFCDVWTVSTLAAWIGKENGSAISTAQTGDQVGLLRIPHETPVAGLYLAGDCAGPARGVGTELACQSGMDCADMVKRHFDLGWLS